MPPKETEENSSYSDDRIDWLKGRVIASLKLREDKWSKLMAEEYAVQLLLSFFETDEINLVFFFINQSDELFVSAHPPNVYKRKAMYFMKAPGIEKIDKPSAAVKDAGWTAMSDSLFYGDVAASVYLH